MKNQSITEAMLQFIEESPTAFHAAANVEALLLENGFEKLENLAEGALVPGRKLLYDAERFCGAGGENPRKSCQGFPGLQQATAILRALKSRKCRR